MIQELRIEAWSADHFEPDVSGVTILMVPTIGSMSKKLRRRLLATVGGSCSFQFLIESNAY